MKPFGLQELACTGRDSAKLTENIHHGYCWSGNLEVRWPCVLGGSWESWEGILQSRRYSARARASWYHRILRMSSSVVASKSPGSEMSEDLGWKHVF